MSCKMSSKFWLVSSVTCMVVFRHNNNDIIISNLILKFSNNTSPALIKAFLHIAVVLNGLLCLFKISATFNKAILAVILN